MKRFLLLLVFLATAASVQGVDKYWIGIGGDNETDGAGGLPIFILQIDQNGNVLKAPVAAIADIEIPPGNGNDERTVALAMSSNGNLIAWIGQDTNDDVWRFTLDPVSLNILAHKRIMTGIPTTDHFQATQPAPRFLATDKPQGKYKGFPVDDSGNSAGKSFRLIPRYEDADYHDSSVSADGLMAVRIVGTTSNTKIAAQPLRPDGRPNGVPSVMSVFDNSFDIDVTSLLPNGRRFIVFNDGTDCFHWLQVLDGATGAKLGSPIQLGSLKCGEANQSIAVDPLGRFVVFDVDGTDAGCSTSGLNPLFFVPLNQSTGQPAGPAKQITSCNLYQNFHGSSTTGQFGIDILRIP